jgi:hypothetical protein
MATERIQKTNEPSDRPELPGDGTRELLQWGGTILGSGLLALLLLQTLLGGFSATGASTNTGWLALIVALGCIPFGSLLLGLGVAKWLRRRGLARGR